ncbi:peroxisomal assembly protein [Xylographa trunciseda]|nr:peroxisomal assembly protein [Xylographa trunciseda]
MSANDTTAEHRKRRRRRRQWKMPISAKLALDGHLKGNVGELSEELFRSVFGTLSKQDTVCYIAITPWRPPAIELAEECAWTILPVKLQPERSNSNPSIWFPSSSPSLQSFAASLQTNKNSIKPKNGFGIVVLEVQPLVLDTICVRVDADSLRKHDEIQKKFGGGFQTQRSNGYSGDRKEKDRTSPQVHRAHGDELSSRTQEGRLKAAIRSSLAESIVVHQGDLLPLPLPAHPITHVPLPPVKLTFCEPLEQGLISGQTKIIIDMSSSGAQPQHQPAARRSDPRLKNMIVEEDEDTSAEQFFSAVETDGASLGRQQNMPNAADPRSSTSDGSSLDEESESDDSIDNIISLTSPNSLAQTPGINSSFSATTPRPMDFRDDGASTPGSVFSSYTATTARHKSQTTGKSFQIKPLFNKIPDSALHPPPSSDEDDEARIYVDVKLLVRLGCFSGDWIKVSSVPISANYNGYRLRLGAFEDDDNRPESFRVLKVYGLPDMFTVSNRGPSNTDGIKCRSWSSTLPKATPIAYVSPILFENLGQPTSVMLSLLCTISHNGTKITRSKIASSSTPPVAKEVTLLRLLTPLATERAMQPGLLICLKQYFETRRRVLKTDDLIGIKVNSGISRILSESGTNIEPDRDLEDLFVNCASHNEPDVDSVGIAWYVVGHIQSSPIVEDQTTIDSETWDGAASIEPRSTRMNQVGTHQGRVPPITNNPWEYYYSTRCLSKTTSQSVPHLYSEDDMPTPTASSIRRRVRELFAVATSSRAHNLGMQPLILLLHSTQSNIGKAFVASSACADLGLHSFQIDSYDLLTETGAGSGDLKTEASFRAKIERALTCGAEHTVPILRHVEALTADRMTHALKDVIHDLRVLVFTTTDLEKIPEGIRSLFTHEIEISAPNETERESILRNVVHSRGLRLAHDVDLATIAVKTAALVAGDLVDVVERASVAREDRLEKLITHRPRPKIEPDPVLLRDILVSGGTSARCVTKADFDIAVEAARKNFADSIGAPKIPNVSWDDVGGLSHVKDAVMETIQLPLERPELFAKGMKKRSGILFYGPPGTGKTLLAKAIATEFSLNFFSVKGPELLNMYIGESEANVRRVFQRARDARPCVVFFDELDSVAPKRGNQGDSGGVMDRIVSQLLAELDGMSNGDVSDGGGVFVIGATNRPDLLDQALLRPGRFDKMLYLGISDSHEKQLTILEALTRKFTLHPDLSLRRIAEALPFTYTGADLYALCSDAMLKAIARQASAVDAKIRALPNGRVTTAYFFDHYATQEDLAVVVTYEDFLAAQRELTGSVSAKELEHYQQVRRTFEGPVRTNNSRAQPPTNKLSLTTSTDGVPDDSIRPRFKSRTSSKTEYKGKGKGKAPQWASADEDDEDEDEAYVTSNDYGTPAQYKSVNGSIKGKRVLKDGVLRDGFQDAAQADEEDLYG